MTRSQIPTLLRYPILAILYVAVAVASVCVWLLDEGVGA